MLYLRSRDSAVGIATGYGLEDKGFGVRVPVVSGLNPRLRSENPAPVLN
jgi:hypothetical protein